MDTNELMKEALAYHAEGGPGKIEIRPTKPDATQYDLSLAYSPGVAAPCLAIADAPAKAYDYTIKGNLVAVITNGTAVLGLGDIGPLAAKPVMEGKCMLFKHFSGINAFDIEIDTIDPEEFIAAVKRIAPTFGGINLEDIKAPECFEIERRLVEELDIPVMHDDQHGTAIIASAALINAMHLSGKRIDEAQIVVNGAGAAAIACARMFLALGARRDFGMLKYNGELTQRKYKGVDEREYEYHDSDRARNGDCGDALFTLFFFCFLSFHTLSRLRRFRVFQKGAHLFHV